MINLNIGQAGCQIGECLWQLICHEHNMNFCGEQENSKQDFRSLQKLFTEVNEKQVPKVMFLDLEPMVIQEIQKGDLRYLFNKNSFLYGKEDSANNYIRAHCTIGKYIFDQAYDQVRRIAESSDKITEFLITHSLCGGTGSGFADIFHERICLDFPKANLINFSVFPSPNYSTNVVGIMNAIQSIPVLAEHSNLTFALDNEAIYQICEKMLGIEGAAYIDINRIISVNIVNMLSRQPIFFIVFLSDVKLRKFA